MENAKKITEFIGYPDIITIACISLFLIISKIRNISYIDCSGIIKNHFKCFEIEGKKSKMVLFLYFVLPAIIAGTSSMERGLDDSVINIVTIIVSILTSMFFTMLTLTIDMRKKISKDKRYNGRDARISKKLLEETYFSLMFEILISITTLIICFVSLFGKRYTFFMSIVVYYSVYVILINMFMVLKRVFKVIEEDMKQKKEEEETVDENEVNT